MVGVIIIIMVVFDAQAAAGAVRARLGLAGSKTKVMASAYTPAAAANAMHEEPEKQKGRPKATPAWSDFRLERAMRFELTTPTLARLCSTPELRPHSEATWCSVPPENRERAYGRAPARWQHLRKEIQAHRMAFDRDALNQLGFLHLKASKMRRQPNFGPFRRRLFTWSFGASATSSGNSPRK